MKNTLLSFAAVIVLIPTLFVEHGHATVLEVLWGVGKSDDNTAEFAFAPADYKAYRTPGFFVVGKSDPKKDWPYVQPGTIDGTWAPGLPQTYLVLFGLKAVPAGDCRLVLDFVDTHGIDPPKLRVTVNKRSWEYQTPKGAGDASVFGEPAKGREHVIEVPVPADVLRAGDNRVSITTLSGSWILWDAVCFHAPVGTSLQAVDPTSIERARGLARKHTGPKPDLEQVIVVYKTHFDIGFTDMAENVVKMYRTSMIDKALVVCDQSKNLPPEEQFVWTIPGWPMKKILDDWNGQTPVRKTRIHKAFKDGRFAVHGLPFTTYTESLELEDLVRGMGYSSQVSRAAGKELPRDAKMTDVPVHTWFVPTLLKHAGITFMHIGTNPASGTANVPLLFYWEGPDGSRVLTMYAANSYGTGLTPPKGWPHKTWLALIHTNDNHGPPNPHEISRILSQAKKQMPGVKVRIGRLSDFGDAILAENPDLPVVRMDMPDTWIHGIMASPIGAKIARNTRPKIAAAELLGTLLQCWSVERPDFKQTIADAYEQSLLYGEHTWGGDGKWIGYATPYGEAWEAFRSKGMDGRFKRLEASWEEHRAYIDSAEKLTNSLLEGDLLALAESIKVDGKRVVVFNPLPWERSGLVLVKLPEDIRALKEYPRGDATSVERSGDRAVFYAKDIPAMGYRTYLAATDTETSQKAQATADKRVVENRFFKITIDSERGTASSIVDKRSGTELVDSQSKYGFGQYLYERFDKNNIDHYLNANLRARPRWAILAHGKPYLPSAKAVPYSAASPSGFEIDIENGRSTKTIVMKADRSNKIPHGVGLKIILYRNLPALDFEISIENKPTEPWPEAGWLCLPLKVDEPRFRLSRLGSIVDPAKDIVDGGNRDLITLNGGMTVTNPEGKGFGLCPMDSPLVSIERPGLWKFSRDFVPKKAAIFVNLYNNMWNCNFRLWQGGSWTSRVRLWTVDKYDSEAALITPSTEIRTPLLGAFADKSGGSLPASQTGLKLSRRGVIVTALGPNPDGDGLILRLWELAGKDGNCEITLPEGMDARTVQPCDLRGRPQGETVPVRNGRFTVAMSHFAPVSLLIRRESNRR